MRGKVFFISDLHFGHERVSKRRGFETVEKHNQYIINRWNNTVKSKDTVWLLGDITMEKKQYYPLLDELKGYKKVVLGNHDKPGHVKELLKYVNSVCGMIKYKHFILSHPPIHQQEIPEGYRNIHGHIHENTIPDDRYINVCCEAVGYTPKTIEELLKM